MTTRRTRGDAERHLLNVLRTSIRQTRRTLGWTQAMLASRSGVSQPQISRLESGSLETLSIADAGRLLDVLGVRTILSLDPPFVAKPRLQRDAAHARCVAYAAGRLRAMGWAVRLEVETHEGRSHGWIDLLAHRPEHRALLVGEVKTEVLDLGAAQRQLGWYARAASAAARSFSWRGNATASALLVLATHVNEARLVENRRLLDQAFPIGARGLLEWLADPKTQLGAPAVALIDPRARRRRWLIASTLDGRRTPLRYANYADFMRRVRGS